MARLVSEAPVPIVGGTGALGFGLALRLAAAGVAVRIGSRRAEAAEEAAEKLRGRVPGADVEGLDNAGAAASGGVVFLTVPFRAQSETLTRCQRGRGPGHQLARSVNVLQLSRVLGHHSPAFTLSRYCHLLGGDEAPPLELAEDLAERNPAECPPSALAEAVA